LKVNQHFRGRYLLHLQGLRVSQARNQHKAGSKQGTSLAETWDYIETEGNLEANPSVLIVSKNQSEPRADRRRVTRFGL
jgi:hypothetical protein